MPRGSWSKKDERMYEKVKKSEQERGRSEDRAKEIAARTVNKQRREEGRAERKESRATGNPNTKLEERSIEELRNRAKQLGIEGRSKMNKKELIGAIRRRG